MQINKADVIWNFSATLLRLLSGLIVLPIVLFLLSSEDVGLWGIFLTVGTFALMLDFGFGFTCARNITYIFSGAKTLKKKGFELINDNSNIEYPLLKGLILVMKRYYFTVAFSLLILLLSVGSIYIAEVLKDYPGNYSSALNTWFLYSLVIVFQLYSLYYDALLQGRGYIKRLKQIIIFSQSVEIIVLVTLLFLDYGLLSLAISRTASITVNRYFSHKTFYDLDLRTHLKNAEPFSPKELIKILTPNAFKIGLTSLGAFLIQRSTFFVGSLFLTLSEFASYSITIQLINAISAVSTIYVYTYIPKIASARIKGEQNIIKPIYISGVYLMLIFYFLGASVLLFLGNPILILTNSNTLLVDRNIILIALLVSLIETNYNTAASIILTKNEVPFLKASLISGFAILALLIVYFNYVDYAIYGLVMVPLIVNLTYQGWKWPLQVYRELDIVFIDFPKKLFNLRFFYD